ncbi:tuberin isoform X4 [Bombyx mori]|uniref:Rap-GAP domain-containing protein n=1 Tax=Bombyx mori TaxID=7091 RepID=A0A8R2QZE0_BOMMO|nr:tuberin isoform X4 [Bombyx mori]
MGSRDRDSKSLQDKLKVFFKKGASAPLAARSELVSKEVLHELSVETPLHRRLRAMKDVGDKVIQGRVEDGGVEKLWSCTRDLLYTDNTEARHTALCFMRCIAEGQAEDLQIMRTIFFKFLRETHPSHPPDDYQLRFKLLYTLTNSGKNINCFEVDIGEFLLEWLPQIQTPSNTVEFLQLIVNVVKFNATYLDEHIVHGIVNNACHLCVYSPEVTVVQQCLSLLEAVVSYSLLPRASLPTFVGALCRTVNMEHYCQNSWKLMRYVVGGDIGPAAVQQMVSLLQSGAEAGAARGAVFYINMALWGPQRVPTLKVSFLAVLPAFLKALEGRQAVVAYEVVVGVASVVTRAPHELYEPAWDVLLRIVRTLLQLDKSYDPPNDLMHSRLHNIITSIEQLQESGQYKGDAEALLDLVDSCGHERPESSTMQLISQRAGALSPTGSEWVASALALADKYIRNESRLNVRLHALHQIMAFITRYGYVYGEELVELVGVPVLSGCALDADVAMRAAAAKNLALLARNGTSESCTDLIDLLEKILNRPFEMYVTDVAIPADTEVCDLRLAAGGLLDVLRARLLHAPAAPARCLIVLLDHLHHHYRRPALFLHHPDIRLKIFEMIFCLRANTLNFVGLLPEGQFSSRTRVVCSPFLLVEPLGVRGQQHQNHQHRDVPPSCAQGACVVPAARAARALCAALTRDAEWAVVGRVLRALPPLLHARALALGRRAHDLDVLASTLCSMISDRSLNFPECLRTCKGGKLLVSEFHGTALPALAALAPYHSCLEPQTQQRIVRCLLKYGMVLRSPQPYINALTIFTLETRDTMVKMLPEVLLDLSKISDTKAIASPMLEFLSTLTRLPKVFASFVEDQYMSVFAILLPYTNPSRYNHYAVSLAHHVIAAWFLKCRLSYRRNFVRFIIHGLHNYIIMPFEEQLQYKSNFQHGAANEDSSNRQRSSSLGSRAVPQVAIGRGGPSASAAFHVELTETCVDLLARYATTPCTVKPQRSDLAEFLFNGGQSMTWLVGHKLVTITTSGCLQNSLKQGLCDRCAALCKQHAESAAGPLPPLRPAASAAPAAPAASAAPTALAANAASAGASQTQLNESTSDSQTTEDSPSQAQNPPEVKRQNSSENNKTTDPLVEVLNQFSQRFERISKEVDTDDTSWSRVGELAGGGACPCWCGGWAEIHVRSPTGDVSWVMRVQNQMNWDYQLESPLQEVAALLNPMIFHPSPPPAAPPPASCVDPPAPFTPPPSNDDNKQEQAQSRAEIEPPSRSALDLHKSNSDTVVSKPLLHQPHRMSTQPINIPGSPQRQGSTSAAGDDDILLLAQEGKSRHPVRRSNSSPEMSSSWKLSAQPKLQDEELDEMILLPGVEPTTPAASMHASKKAAKKSDMRVSCEAIPEEMCGTSPLAAHPHLVTYKSDPAVTSEPLSCAGTGHAAGGAGADSGQRAAADDTAHHQLQKTASEGAVPESRSKPPRAPARDDLPPLARSKRSNTISVMSPTRRHRQTPNHAPPINTGPAGAPTSSSGSGCAGASGGGLTPSFVFLQLYHNMSTYPITPPVPGESPTTLSPLSQRPLRVSSAQDQRTIKNLDLMPPIETYKIGVLYVAPGQQDSEDAILQNEYGSVRYSEFLTQLGTLVSLEGEDEQEHPELFLNLEKGGKDGRYTYVWTDDIMQVLFHVATAMPTCASDPSCNEKRKYIGNDYVSIVYNDSGADFNIHTIKGQFNLCIVVVEPYEHGMNRVLLKTKDERIRTKFLAHLDSQHVAVSDHNVALLARQMALHCALASQISATLSSGGGSQPYASNWLARLRLIKMLRGRVQASRLAAAARAPAPYASTPDLAQRVAIDDFNDYT